MKINNCLRMITQDWSFGAHKITSATAELISLLFPKLLNGHFELDLVRCTMEASFFKVLVGRAHGLRWLSFSECCDSFFVAKDSRRVLPLLSGLPLNYLYLDMCHHWVPAEVVSGLKQLSELHIVNAELDNGFQEVLPQLTCLSTLVLDYCPFGMALSSPSLRTLVVDCALHWNDLGDFPELKFLQLKGLNLADIVDLADRTNASPTNALLAFAQELASSSAQVKMGSDNGEFSFIQVPADLFAPMLEALMPLRRLLQDVVTLELESSGYPDEESLALLSRVFQNLSILHYDVDCDIDSIDGAPMLMPNLSCMKFLEKLSCLTALSLPVDSVPPDCLCTLLRAGVLHRSFTLTLRADHWNNNVYYQPKLLADQWKLSQSMFPGVCLQVS